MKVMHIISGGDSGGAKTHLFNLCKGSSGMFENIVGCINKGKLFDEANRNGFDTLLFSQSGRADFNVAKDIKRAIDENDIDIVDFHGARPNFIYSIVRNKINIPAVTTVHSDFRYDFLNDKLKYIAFTPINILSLKKFDNYICVSDKIKDLLEHKGFKGCKYVVRNGIDTNVKIEKSRDEIRRDYGISDDAFVYTMVARFHPVKNHMGFLMAAEKIIREFKDINIMLIGSGAMENELKKKARQLNIADKVIFTGQQDNPIDYINAGDVNVLTSFSETFPIVILEGAVAGKSAICSNVGDIEEILNEDTGFIIDPLSVENIYIQMKKAYVGREKLKYMGRNLHDIVVSDYSLNAFCRRYYDCYKNILSGG
ncbi:MAG TPA: glycosyltransferase family 1 protein [Clostridiaceae bacterium]|nr:glycosyltransferase family 1 protein [Clostridiaceae bacterium]